MGCDVYQGINCEIGACRNGKAFKEGSASPLYIVLDADHQLLQAKK